MKKAVDTIYGAMFMMNSYTVKMKKFNNVGSAKYTYKKSYSIRTLEALTDLLDLKEIPYTWNSHGDLFVTFYKCKVVILRK